jgi:hypothetical protein
MPNRTEARPAKAVLPYATGRLPPLRLFSTPLKSFRYDGSSGPIFEEFNSSAAALSSPG